MSIYKGLEELMPQARKPKLSSRAKRLLEQAKTSRHAFAAAGMAGDEDVIDDAWLAWTYESRKLLLRDLANLRDESALPWFWRRRKGILVELAVDVMELRDELRGVWIGLELNAQSVLNKWLRWQPSKELVQDLQQFGVKATDFGAFTCSISARRLVPNYLSLRSMLIQGVFEHWGHFKYCRNKDCASPYFIAKRKDQTVCDSEACKAEKQREHALKWWTANRAKNVSAKVTKGRSKNGTLKAR